MKNFTFVVLGVIFCQFLTGQEQITSLDSISNSVEIDKMYKEDQFYFGLAYNLLNKMPENMSQHGFSAGVSLGFIKDIPLNKARNMGLGLGLGFSSNSINHNLKISKTDNDIYYEFLDADEFTKNKLATQLIEVPLEIRWRNSTPEIYKFWRIYAGIKFGYLISSKTKFKGGGESLNYSNIDAFEKLNYGLTLNAGYSTWNVSLYYGLNSIFDESVVVNNKKVDTKVAKIGLIFYLL